jgi:hypothetical protein
MKTVIAVELVVESKSRDKKKLLKELRSNLIGKSSANADIGCVSLIGIKYPNEDRPRVPDH